MLLLFEEKKNINERLSNIEMMMIIPHGIIRGM
jgi:hypothetical protein